MRVRGDIIVDISKLIPETDMKQYYMDLITAIGNGDFTALHKHTATCPICKSGYSVEINNLLSAGTTIEEIQIWAEDNGLVFTKTQIKEHKNVLPLMIAVQVTRDEKAADLNAMQMDVIWLMKKSDHARATHLLEMWDLLLPQFLERLMVMLNDCEVPFERIISGYEKVLDLAMKVNVAIAGPAETEETATSGLDALVKAIKMSTPKSGE